MGRLLYTIAAATQPHPPSFACVQSVRRPPMSSNNDGDLPTSAGVALARCESYPDTTYRHPTAIASRIAPRSATRACKTFARDRDKST
jgi:hypothetical protein